MIYIVALLLILALVFEALVLKRGLKSSQKNAAYLRNDHATPLNTSRANKRVKTPPATAPLPELQKDEEPALHGAEKIPNVIEFPEKRESSLSEGLRQSVGPVDREKSVHDMIQEIRGSSLLQEAGASLPRPGDLEKTAQDEYEEVADSEEDEYEEVAEYEEIPPVTELNTEKTISIEPHSPTIPASIEEAKETPEFPEAEEEAFEAEPAELDEPLEEVEIVPSPEELLKNGIRYVRQGKLDEGIAALEQAVASAPDKAEAHFNLGIAYTLQEFQSSAIRSYQKAIELDPQYGKAFFNLGTLYLKQGNTEDAIDKLEKAVTFLNDPMKALWNLYEAYRGSESFSKALSTLERLIDLEPDDASLNNHLGICYAKLGKYSEAIEAWQRSVSLGASSRLIFYNLGKTYELCEKTDEAIEQYEYFLQLNSQGSNWTELMEEVEERLKNLRGEVE